MLAIFMAAALLAPQDPADSSVVRRSQAHRTEVIARVAPAVCSVMPVNSQGGGSGVIIDPLGFVLTNFHVVQRRKERKKPAPPGAPPEAGQPKPPGEPAVDPGERARAVRKQLEPLFPGVPWDRFPALLEDLHRPDVPAYFAERKDYERFKKKLDELHGWLPTPRWAELPADDDGDDPAWGVMKIGLPDGQVYLADTLGIDPGSDLAILLLRPRAGERAYPFVDLGDSDALLVGETVFAMGNPFLLATDFTPTVTWGVVSGTHRYQGGSGNRFLVYPDCVQVDAPVNPGNSGGPLFNEAGEVVGINGRISVRDRGRVNTGVGFAIASNQIRNFLGDMMAGRHSEHGTLDMNAWFMNAPDEKRRGVFVQSMFRDSKVGELGVSLGDELLRFNGEPVRAANQLATRVGVLPEGSWVNLTFRPRRGEGGFGPEQTVFLALPRMDTGSSRDEDRIASRAHRGLARQALTRDVGAGEDTAGSVTIEVRAPHDGAEDGAPGVVRLMRRGELLRLEAGDLVLVRTGTSTGFAIEGGTARDLTAEEAAKLERAFTTDPLLWRGEERRKLVGESLLEGGVFVFGRPAYRFGLAGDGEREVFLYEDGTPAGCRYRDPLRKKLIEYRYGPDGAVRVVSEGQLETGWKVSVAFAALDEALFRRPQ